jgi:hypothetical protein
LDEPGQARNGAALNPGFDAQGVADLRKFSGKTAEKGYLPFLGGLPTYYFSIQMDIIY